MKHLLAVMLILLSGCTSSHVLVGKQRPPISPADVQIYLDPPAQYEKVAVLESNNRASFAFTQQQKTNKVVDRLKEEAAALGANGILLQGVGDQYAGSVGSANAWASGGSAYGIGFSSATYLRVGSGIAIYVPAGVSATSIQAPVQQMAEAPASSMSTAAPAAPAPTSEASRLVAPQPYESDPAKRCDACARLKVP
jgi:hypothetical protein